jgi:replication-associated recombination protein RarA
MMHQSSFEHFIFHGELRTQLEQLLINPKDIPSPLCFYGQPGTGKTSFAQLLAESVAHSVNYFDMNEYKTNGASSGKVLQDIKRIAATYSVLSLFSDGNPTWERAIILDEWHNATPEQQDAYKVPFEKYGKNNRVLFLLCMNTTEKKTLGTVMSPAIRSRCHTISFDITQTQRKEVTTQVKARFPCLSNTMISTLLPDFRQMTREAKLLQAMGR